MDEQTQGTVSGVSKVMGTLASARGTLDAGRSARTAAGFQAAQMRVNAGQQEAASQRGSEEKLREARLLASRAIAVAGASGAGVSDITVTNIVAQILGEGKLSSLTDLYEGGEAAAGMRRQAAATEYEGESVYRAAKTKSLSTLLTSAGGMSDMFPAEKKREVKTQKAAPVEERSWNK